MTSIATVPAAPGPGLLAPGTRALTLGLVLVITLVAFEALATATVMPAAQKDLGNLALYGWSFSAFLLASLVGITLAGEQADRHGPARPFVAGLALFAVGLGIAGVAPAMWVLVVGRAVQGLGGGVVPPIAYVAIGRGYPESLRPRMLALFATAWVVPGLVGPGLAGAVAEYASWRLVFLGILPFVGLSVLLALPALHALGKPEEYEPAPSRLRHAVQLALGVGLLLGGLSAWHVVATPLLLAAGVVVTAPAFRALLPPGTLRAKEGVPAVVAGMALLNLAFFGADAFVPLMLTRLRDQSTLMAGLVITTATLSWTSGTWLLERSKGRLGPRTMVRIGLGLIAVGALGLLPVLADPVSPWLAVGTWMIAGLGIGIAYPSFSLLVLEAAEPGREGVATSSMKLGESLANATAAGVGGAIIAAGEAASRETEAMGSLFVLMALVALAGAALAVRLPHK